MIHEETWLFHGDGIGMPSLQKINRSSGIPMPEQVVQISWIKLGEC
jgi:hypothetical protein